MQLSNSPDCTTQTYLALNSSTATKTMEPELIQETHTTQETTVEPVITIPESLDKIVEGITTVIVTAFLVSVTIAKWYQTFSSIVNSIAPNLIPDEKKELLGRIAETLINHKPVVTQLSSKEKLAQLLANPDILVELIEHDSNQVDKDLQRLIIDDMSEEDKPDAMEYFRQKAHLLEKELS